MQKFDKDSLKKLVDKVKMYNEDKYTLCISENSWNNYQLWQKEYINRIATEYNAEIKILKDNHRGLRSGMMIYEDYKGKEIDL